jgi:hypothetical protein
MNNPLHHEKDGWYWGSVGPQPTRKAMMKQVRAIYASGYEGHNPLTLKEKQQLKDWGNMQFAISKKYANNDLVRSEFYHGRSVAAGKIAKQFNPIHHKKDGWYWGSVGPKPTREAMLRQVRAIYASGYKGHNPTMVMPFKSEKQFEHLFNAQRELNKAGVSFDTGTKLTSPMERHWELDWSLKGAKMKNPDNLPKFTDKQKSLMTGKKIGDYVYLSNGLKLTYQKWLNEVHKESSRRPIRIVSHPRIPKRNPTSIEQKIGNILGGLGLLSIPLFIGGIIWLNHKYGEKQP